MHLRGILWTFLLLCVSVAWGAQFVGARSPGLFSEPELTRTESVSTERSVWYLDSPPARIQPSVRFAAKELRRYLYHLSGTLAPLHRSSTASQLRSSLSDVCSKTVSNDTSSVHEAVLLLVASHRAIGSLLKPLTQLFASDEPSLLAAVSSLTSTSQHHVLHTLQSSELPQCRIHLVLGGDAQAVLFGSYRLAHHWGVRFYLHGDTLPDPRVVSVRRVAASDGLRHRVYRQVTDLEPRFRKQPLPALHLERNVPIFSKRGIQPFHDFAEGTFSCKKIRYLCPEREREREREREKQR